MTTEVHWNRLTASELNDRAKADAIVLLPVASVEQHGPHLGTGVDMFLAAEGCRRTAEIVAKSRAIVVAPTVWMGLAEHHVAYGGTFTLSITTYHALLRDLCRSILRAGFKKILIVNGHGGNIAALNALATDLAQELDAPIAVTTLYNLAHEKGAYKAILEDQEGVRHACEAETSMMMTVAPDCVRKDKIKDAHGALTATRGLGVMSAINVWRSFKELTPSGVIGDARKATPEKGEKLFDTAAELLAVELLKGAPWA
ncbi:MAG: creatininase family protein [Hyphomicrobiaceae bacterium]